MPNVIKDEQTMEIKKNIDTYNHYHRCCRVYTVLVCVNIARLLSNPVMGWNTH
jgi:hypothetical protein